MTIHLVYRELKKAGEKRTIIDKAFTNLPDAQSYITGEETIIKLNQHAFERQKITQIVFKIKELVVQ